MLTTQGAWSGRTIQYIHDNIDASLAQKPNLILLQAGTNDMNTLSGPDGIAKEGNDPSAAVGRFPAWFNSVSLQVLAFKLLEGNGL